MDVIDLLILIVVFQFKHFIADYLLQGRYMLGKFKEVGWEKPLVAHCSVHFVFTLVILMFVVPQYAVLLALADFCVHFIIDRIKVVKSRKYDKDVDKEFWWALGADQLAHHLTHYAIVFIAYFISIGALYGNVQ